MRTLTSIALLLLMYCVSGIQFTELASSGDQLEQKLSTNVRDYSLTADSFADAFVKVATKFHIPMGIAWIDTREAETKQERSWKNATIADMIEAIAKTQPGYEVRTIHGVVHVYPKLIPRQQDFLTIKIPDFNAENEPVELLWNKLRDLAKMTVSPAPMQPSVGGTAGSQFFDAGEPKIQFHLANVTVQDVLDRLAGDSARKIWVVTFTDDPTLTPTGFRRTLSLWSPSRLADKEQPVWDMFHWGDAVPSTGLRAK
jgi:hypothetical protein